MLHPCYFLYKFDQQNLTRKEEFITQIKQAQEATLAYRLKPEEFDVFYTQVMSDEEIDLKKEFLKFKIILDNEGIEAS